MIKTIKVKKQLRLDELIKHVWESNVFFKGKRQICFEVDGQEGQGFVCFENNAVASFTTSRYIESDETFTVEVEEEIDNTTIFKSVVGVLENDRIVLTNTYSTIKDIQDEYGTMKEIYAVIDGKLQLIWEAE